MDLLRIWRLYFIQVFTIVFCTRESQSGISNLAFDKFDLQGRYLQVYDTQKEVRSSMHCAYTCMNRRSSSPLCHAFVYHPLNRTCVFYIKAVDPTEASILQVFSIKLTAVWHTISLRGRRYIFRLPIEKKSYSDARAHCHTIGGYLLQLDSDDEYEALGTLMLGEQYGKAFVGINDIEIEDNWVWDKDNTTVDTDLLRWVDNKQPNNLGGKEDCALLMLQTFELADVDCDLERRFLCEIDV